MAKVEESIYTDEMRLKDAKRIVKDLLEMAIKEQRELDSTEIRKLEFYQNEIKELENGKGDKQMKDLMEFRNFLTDESRKSYRFDNEEVRAVTTMANNLDVQQQRIVNMVVQQLIERADLFSLCEAFTPANGVLVLPREDGANVTEAEFVGENASIPTHQLKFDVVKAEAKRVGVCVSVTQKMMMDSGINIQEYVLNLLVRKLAKAINKQMVVGNHATSVQGLHGLTSEADGIAELTATALTSDVLVDMVNALHPDLLEEAVFVMNRKSYNAISKLKTADGQYILKLEPSVAVEKPRMTVFGFPVLLNDCVADGELFFANMRKAYASVKPMNMAIKKIDADSQNALNGTALFMIEAYVDAVLKDGQAVVKMTLQA